MTTLRTAAQQALEALENPWAVGPEGVANAITALRAALAEPVQEPDLSRCPQCGGPADNGHDRSIPPNPYFCTKCMAEPVPVAWMHVPYPGSGLRQMVSLMRNREPSLYAATVPLFIAPPQRPAEPVQEPYDQTALELCNVCGWKTLIPGDCCLNCERKHPLGQASTDVPLTVYSVKKAEPVQENKDAQ